MTGRIATMQGLPPRHGGAKEDAKVIADQATAWDLLGVSRSLCRHARWWMGAHMSGVVTASGFEPRGELGWP